MLPHVPSVVTDLDPVLRRLADEIAGYELALDDLPVAPTVSPTEIRERLSTCRTRSCRRHR
jgi:hypothetical protein